MVKVLQILNGLHRGGMETFVMNLYRAVDKEEIQFDFLLNQPGGDYEKEVRSYGANIFYFGSRRKDGLINYFHNLDIFFKEHSSEYIAVHYHESTLTSIEPLYFAKKYGIERRLLHAHSSSVSGSRLHYLTHYLNKLFVKRMATHYLGCSQKALEWFYNGTGVMSKSHMIPNGINVSNYVYNESKRRIVRKEFGIEETELIIGHVGRFMWIKNHKFLIEIFEKIQERVESSRLLLIGKGPLLEQTKQLVDSLGIGKSVLFLGVRTDITDILQAIDVVIMPSIYEGLPVSLVEAQAAGVLVYGSDTISKDCAITPEMHFISLHENASNWANQVLKGLDGYQRSTSSAEYVRNAGFDIKNIANQLTRLYCGTII